MSGPQLSQELGWSFYHITEVNLAHPKLQLIKKNQNSQHSGKFSLRLSKRVGSQDKGLTLHTTHSGLLVDRRPVNINFPIYQLPLSSISMSTYFLGSAFALTKLTARKTCVSLFHFFLSFSFPFFWNQCLNYLLKGVLSYRCYALDML